MSQSDSRNTTRSKWASWLLGGLGAVLAIDGLVLLLGLGLSSFGVTFPLLIGLALTVWAFQRRRIRAWVQGARWRRGWWRVGCLALGIWLLTLVVFFVALSRQPTGAGGLQPPVRAVIVLGSGTPGGQPSPPLRARLDLALDIAARFPQALVAVSGCVDFGETRSEGQVMGDYLRAKGLAAIRIVQEEASTSTELNLKLSQPVLAARGVGLNDPVVVVTSDFHTWRAQRIAQRQGWQQVQTVGAPTPLYIRYNAWLREYFAIASSTLLGEM
ncbi:MAG: YdcF family protein [Ottowia sp.]|nr:YdcF family protein [Ottowia sp.]